MRAHATKTRTAIYVSGLASQTSESAVLSTRSCVKKPREKAHGLGGNLWVLVRHRYVAAANNGSVAALRTRVQLKESMAAIGARTRAASGHQKHRKTRQKRRGSVRAFHYA